MRMPFTAIPAVRRPRMDTDKGTRSAAGRCMSHALLGASGCFVCVPSCGSTRPQAPPKRNYRGTRPHASLSPHLEHRVPHEVPDEAYRPEEFSFCSNELQITTRSNASPSPLRESHVRPSLSDYSTHWRSKTAPVQLSFSVAWTFQSQAIRIQGRTGVERDDQQQIHVFFMRVIEREGTSCLLLAQVAGSPTLEFDGGRVLASSTGAEKRPIRRPKGIADVLCSRRGQGREGGGLGHFLPQAPAAAESVVPPTRSLDSARPQPEGPAPLGTFPRARGPGRVDGARHTCARALPTEPVTRRRF